MDLKIFTPMTSESGDVLEMAAMIARDYLHGPWKRVTPKSIVLKQIKGGLSNWLYQMSLPPAAISQKNIDSKIPQTVLLRFHGQVNGESAFEHIVTESVIFTMLSERCLGPKLHGIFPGGRIEEYLNARPLNVSEMSEPKISSMIAQRLAQVHQLQVPVCKRPIWFYNLCSKYLDAVEQILEHVISPNRPKFFDYFEKYDMRAELDWLRSYIHSINSPVVFCHNDMNEGNILLPLDQTSKKDLILIDFEYCAYNYRGFDIANHFLEHTITYTSESPYFVIDENMYPSDECQMNFMREYLATYDPLCLEDPNVLERTVKDMMKEVDSFRIAVHFFWALWSAANSSSKIPFNYSKFFECRIESYLNLKEEILSFEVPGSKRQKT